MQVETLYTALSAVNGASFVGLDMLTTPELSGGKSNPMQGRVTKLVTGASVMVFQNKLVNGYEAMVKRRLASEGKDPEAFVLSPRKWGERVPGLPIVTHKGNTYFECIFLRGGKTEYFLDGEPIEKSQIVGLKAPREGEQGGLEDKVIPRTPDVASIIALRVDGQEFR